MVKRLLLYLRGLYEKFWASAEKEQNIFLKNDFISPHNFLDI